MVSLDTSPALPPKVSVQAKTVPKVETGGWKSVKVEQRSFTRAASLREQRRNGVSSEQQVVVSVRIVLVFPVLQVKHACLGLVRVASSWSIGVKIVEQVILL